MTNLEAIKNYSLEEMAKFIAEHDKNCDIADGKYCSEICDQRVKGRCKHDECVRLYMTDDHLCEQLSRFGSIEPLADFYCAFGERRENDDY